MLLKNIGLDTMILFTKGTKLTFFDQLKIPMKLSINLKVSHKVTYANSVDPENSLIWV